MPNRLSIRTQIALVFTVMLFLVVGVRVVSFRIDSKLIKAFEEIVLVDTPRAGILTELKFYARRMEDEALRLSGSVSTSSISDSKERFAVLFKEIREAGRSYAALSQVENAGSFEFSSAVRASAEEAASLVDILSRARSSGRTGDPSYAAAERQLEEERKELLSLVDRRLAAESEARELKSADVASLKRLAITLSVSVLVFVILSFSYLVFFILAKIIRSIKKLNDAAHDIALGDFSKQVHISSSDELGELALSFNAMAKSLDDAEKARRGLETVASERANDLAKKAREFQEAEIAVTNLLEDAKESEENQRRQAASLKRALDEVHKFASIADQERNTYLLLVASIGEGVIAFDLNRKVTLINKVTENILGYGADELVGGDFEARIKFVHKGKKPLEPEFWERVLREKKPVSLSSDISVVTKGGVEIAVSLVVSPVIDAKDNALRGAILTFRDVREERQLEETRVSFISVASHQLRTPLTSMRWFSEMLLAGDAGALSEDQKHFIERIYEGTDRMINLVSLLLQIARVEARRLKVEPVSTDLKHLTNGVALSLKANLDAKSHKVVVSSEPADLPPVPIDQEIFWQVVQNLLSNAIRYSPEQSVISVSMVKKGDLIEYSVKDQGIGIPDDEKSRIFEKFYRAENALKYVPEGSGLGLVLVRSLVEGWGGRIWFESKEGEGTTFTFTLPVAGMERRQGEVSIAI
ncbi:MAG: HAMP domain-containing protein [Candidatus Taylorbacteria bacterium]|nr:HAMP domain-containing protein [Candidatus Taylorbacteria bacterium]